MGAFITCASCSLDIVPRAIHDKTLSELAGLHEARGTDLLEANNRLLERARAAEKQRDDYFAAIVCLTQLAARIAADAAGVRR